MDNMVAQLTKGEADTHETAQKTYAGKPGIASCAVLVHGVGQLIERSDLKKSQWQNSGQKGDDVFQSQCLIVHTAVAWIWEGCGVLKRYLR